MLGRIIDKTKEVLYDMGLIKGLKQVSQHKDIAFSEEMERRIRAWKELYAGYHPDLHDIQQHSIGNGIKKRRIRTINAPKVVSEEIASLVFNEKCKVSVSDEAYSEWIDDVLEDSDFYPTAQRYFEYMFALGGMVIKPYVEGERIKLTFVTAESFFPVSWTNNNVKEGVFVHEVRRGKQFYRHLEWHLKQGNGYVIRHELYKANNLGEIGVRVPLQTLFDDLAEEIFIDNLIKPLFYYFKPNIANNFDLNSPTGISIYANSIDTLQSLDIAFDSLQREFRLGRKRIIVPDRMLRTVIDPLTKLPSRYFDSTDEVYEGFRFDNENEGITEINSTLRVEEHISAINALLNILAIQIGFSAGTFTFDGVSMKTATEVVSEKSETFKTKQSHEVIIEAGLKHVIDSIGVLAELYDLQTVPEDLDIKIAFDDSIAEDNNAERQNQIQLVQAGLTSRLRAIMTVHKCTKEEASIILAEIRAEELREMPELDEFERFIGEYGQTE